MTTHIKTTSFINHGNCEVTGSDVT